MANKFPSALGNDAGNGAEESLVKSTSDDDAERAIGSYHAFSFGGVTKFAGKGAQNPHLSITSPETGPSQQFRRSQRFARAKRIANGSHSTRQRSAQDRPQHRRKQVSVLVRIHVGNADTGRLDL